MSSEEKSQSNSKTPIAPTRKRALSSTEKLTSVQKKTTIVPIKFDMGEEAEQTTKLVLQKLAKLDQMDKKLDNIESDTKEMKSTLEEYQHSLEYTQGQLENAIEEIGSLKIKMNHLTTMEQEIETLKMKNKYLEDRAIAIEAYTRRENIVIDGLKERDFENPDQACQDLFHQLGVGPFPLHRCHRLGKTRQGRERRMIVRFVNYQDKIAVMTNCKHLKGTNIYINNDLPIEFETRRTVLRRVLKHVKQADKEAKLVNDQIKFKGTLYSIDNLSKMPVNLDGLDMKENDTHVLFSGELTPLSNFYKCQIKLNDVVHSSTEHLFQYERSIMLDRRDVAVKVIAAPTPFEAMKAGREVNIPKDWDISTGKQLMTDILKAKVE